MVASSVCWVLVLALSQGVSGIDIFELFEGVDDIQGLNQETEDMYYKVVRSNGIERDDVTLALRYRYIMTQKHGTDIWEFCDPQPHNCSSGDVFYIKTPNFPLYPPGYPPSQKLDWEFIGDSSVSDIEIRCPIISTRWDRGCRRDFIKVSWGPQYIYNKKCCGIFINKIISLPHNPIKITFKSNPYGTRLGFLCQVMCQAPRTTLPPPPTTTVTTTTTTTATTTTTPLLTTFMPGCPEEPVCNPVLIPASVCADMVLPSNCECLNCLGELIITCNICTPCDLSLFQEYEITVPIRLELICECPWNVFDPTDYMCGNEDNVISLNLCTGSNNSCYDLATFVNVTIVYFKPCIDGLCYDTCLNTLSPCRRSNSRFVGPSMLTSTGSHQQRVASDEVTTVTYNCDAHTRKCEKLTLCHDTVIKTNEYTDSSAVINMLTYDLPNAVTLETNFLTIESSSGVTKVTLWLNSTLVPYIPSALATLLSDVEVEVKYGAWSPPCSSCGNVWLWSSEDVASLGAKCDYLGQEVEISSYVTADNTPTCG